MTFEDFNLNSPLQKALAEQNFITPTAIQQKAFSPIMSGKDVLAIAQTGTGKTIAYLLPCLRQWNFSKEKFIQILILVPTRELVLQVVEEVKKMAQYQSLEVGGVFGGANINIQRELIHKGLDVLVATPGRLVDFLKEGTIKTKLLKKLVIDEVDEMLDLGFRAQLNAILDLLPKKRQNIMFSATITEDVEKLIFTHFNSPVKIEAAPSGTPLKNITQIAYKVENFNTKLNLLDYLLQNDQEMKKVLVFCSSKVLADLIFDELNHLYENQISIIHSGKTQPQRFDAIRLFKENISKILIATDLISRGIDISEVSHVINFDLPDSAEQYIHRIGRTGRAGENGQAISFISKKDKNAQEEIQTLMGKKIKSLKMPENVEISTVLADFEMPKPVFNEPKEKTVFVPSGPSFHEKSAKNKKTNKHLTRAAQMRLKYGKSKTLSGKKRK